MGKPKSSFQTKLEVGLARGFSRFFQILPHRTAQNIGGMIGYVFHDLVGIRKKVAINQLMEAFPNRSRKWAEVTVRELYRNLAIHAVELARFPKLLGNELDNWFVLKGKKHIKEAHAQNHGTLCVSAHMGAWEFYGAWAAQKGYPVSYVVAQQTNNQIEEMIDDYRRLFGIKIIKRMNATKNVIKALRNNDLLALMLDQDGGKAGVQVPFFGKNASTFRGVATLALKMDAPILLLASQRLPKGRVLAICEPYKYTKTNDREADIIRMTAEMTKWFEDQIRKRPHEWLWLHRRWKHGINN